MPYVIKNLSCRQLSDGISRIKNGESKDNNYVFKQRKTLKTLKKIADNLVYFTIRIDYRKLSGAQSFINKKEIAL
jgi:hypothetical protein